MKINENQKKIALHLIEEDLKYHRLIRHMAELDVHIEFYPDLATAVLSLLWPDIKEKELENKTNQYVQLVGNSDDQELDQDQILKMITKSVAGCPICPTE